MTEDRDMVEDANDPALSGLFKIGHAPGAVLQLSAHCRPKDRATIAIPTPRNVECTRQYGWGEGPTEFAHNMASFELASKRPSGLQYGSRRRRGYDVETGLGDAAATKWIFRGDGVGRRYKFHNATDSCLIEKGDALGLGPCDQKAALGWGVARGRLCRNGDCVKGRARTIDRRVGSRRRRGRRAASLGRGDAATRPFYRIPKPRVVTLRAVPTDGLGFGQLLRPGDGDAAAPTDYPPVGRGAAASWSLTSRVGLDSDRSDDPSDQVTSGKCLARSAFDAAAKLFPCKQNVYEHLTLTLDSDGSDAYRARVSNLCVPWRYDDRYLVRVLE